MKRIFIFLAVLLIGLLGVRLMLPSLIKKKANQLLMELPGYTGHIDNVSAALWRGAFSFYTVRINHQSGDSALAIQRFDVRIRWLPLLRRRIVVTLLLSHPEVTMILEKPSESASKIKNEAAQPVEHAKEKKNAEDLPDLLRSILPFKVETFYLADGTVHLREVDPNLEVQITDLNVTITNLTNSKKVSGDLTAEGEASARIKQGRADLRIKVNPSAKPPVFELRADVKDLDLTELNPLLDAQWGVEVQKGIFSVFSEASASGGSFKGYVRPLLYDLKMRKSVNHTVKRIKEAVVGAVVAILKNSKTDSVASQVPFQGQFANPNAGLWSAVIEVLRHGFIEALRPRFDRNFKPNPQTPLTLPAP